MAEQRPACDRRSRMSTLCELTLLAVCAAAAWRLVRRRVSWAGAGAVGFGLVGLAAGLGALRYAGVDVAGAHAFASGVASAVGVPLVGVAWLARGWGAPPRALVGSGALLVGSWVVTWTVGVGWWSTLVGAVAMLAVLAAALRRRGRALVWGALGALATVVAGLGIGTEGAWGSLLRVDLFHLVLAGANGALAVGLLAEADRKA